MNSVHLLQMRPKNVQERKIDAVSLGFVIFRERESTFSLGFQPIGPSDFFGPRSKVVLRSEGYAWAPVSGSFDKLHEVGVFSYLIYPLFKCFVNALVDLRP